MLDILDRLRTSLDRRETLAFCQLVETRGSTPQKAGAAMLVYPDGAQAGTLGGGCVEAEVRRQAIALLASGAARVIRFDLDNDYGWDDGLICGGRMQVWVEPLRGAVPTDFFRQLIAVAQQGAGGAEVVAFDREKSPMPVPSGYLFDAHGRLRATLRTGGEEPLAEVARWLEENVSVPGRPGPGSGPSAQDKEMPAGDRPRTRPLPSAVHGIAFLPLLPTCRLLIVGGGHVGKAVAELAAGVDFDVWVVDDRESFVTPERFPTARRRIVGSIDRILPEIEVNRHTYCLIVTRGHRHDEQALYHLVDRDACYVGMIGSRRKIRLIFDDLLAEGVSPHALRRVHAPVGLDIGSQTVAEIAVSIVAELVAHRNRGGVVPGRSGAPLPVELP